MSVFKEKENERNRIGWDVGGGSKGPDKNLALAGGWLHLDPMQISGARVLPQGSSPLKVRGLVLCTPVTVVCWSLAVEVMCLGACAWSCRVKAAPS